MVVNWFVTFHVIMFARVTRHFDSDAMESRARRSVSRPCYKECDSFTEDVPLNSPPAAYALPPRKAVQINDSDSSSDQNQAQFTIVSNEYPKIVIDVSSKLNRTPVTLRRGNRPRRKSAICKEAEEATTKLANLAVGSNVDDEDSDNAITEKATGLSHKLSHKSF